MKRSASIVIIGVVIVFGLLPSPAMAWFGQGDRSIELRHGAGSLAVELVPDQGRALILKQDGSHRWSFEGSTADLVGGSYSIVLRNRSSERLKVVVGIDGLNVYRKNRIVGRADSDTGSILSPGEIRTLKGWQMDSRIAQRFVFSPPEWSEGEGRSEAHIGLIVVQVYRERRHDWFGLRDEAKKVAPRGNRSEEFRQKAAPRPQIGTTSGDDIDSRVRTVSFESLTTYPEVWAEIDYGRRGESVGCRGDVLLGLSLSRADRGSRIVSVVPGSIADAAGLQVGDVIVRIDTEDRPWPGTVKTIVGAKRSGQFVFIRVERGRHEISLKIRL
jgi:hypothetical protein